jgi:hypothetical protein
LAWEKTFEIADLNLKQAACITWWLDIQVVDILAEERPG